MTEVVGHEIAAQLTVRGYVPHEPTPDDYRAGVIVVYSRAFAGLSVPAGYTAPSIMLFRYRAERWSIRSYMTVRLARFAYPMTSWIGPFDESQILESLATAERLILDTWDGYRSPAGTSSGPAQLTRVRTPVDAEKTPDSGDSTARCPASEQASTCRRRNFD